MALLVDTGISGWMSNQEIAAQLRAQLPGADIRTPDVP